MQPKLEPTDDPVVRMVLSSFAEGIGVAQDRAAHLSGSADRPSLRARDLIATLLSFAVECGAAPHQCVYVSTPITTGRNHIDRLMALAANGNEPGGRPDRAEVIASNKQRARAVAEHIRAVTGDTVIDPTSLIDIPGWEQYDYHSLWIATIEEFAKSIVFVDDWQYSVGCTTEFRAAVGLGIPVLDQRQSSFTYPDGLRLLRAAVDEVGSAPNSGPLLVREVNVIEDLLAGRAPVSRLGDGM